MDPIHTDYSALIKKVRRQPSLNQVDLARGLSVSYITVKIARKEIFTHLGELASLTETMSEKEQLAIIQREFDRLYDPRHPVRNHVETLDSVEVVKIIRDALKR